MEVDIFQSYFACADSRVLFYQCLLIPNLFGAEREDHPKMPLSHRSPYPAPWVCFIQEDFCPVSAMYLPPCPKVPLILLPFHVAFEMACDIERPCSGFLYLYSTTLVDAHSQS